MVMWVPSIKILVVLLGLPKTFIKTSGRRRLQLCPARLEFYCLKKMKYMSREFAKTSDSDMYEYMIWVNQVIKLHKTLPTKFGGVGNWFCFEFQQVFSPYE